MARPNLVVLRLEVSFGWFGIGIFVLRFAGEVVSFVWERFGGSTNPRGCVVVWWGGGGGGWGVR